VQLLHEVRSLQGGLQVEMWSGWSNGEKMSRRFSSGTMPSESSSLSSPASMSSIAVAVVLLLLLETVFEFSVGAGGGKMG
jgi:hypothetical protein